MSEFDAETFRKRRGAKRPFDLLSLFPPGYYHIPELVMRLNQMGINCAHALRVIKEQVAANRTRLSVERTSEIFITGHNTRGGRVEKRRLSFYPLINGCWMSHLAIRPS